MPSSDDRYATPGFLKNAVPEDDISSVTQRYKTPDFLRDVEVVGQDQDLSFGEIAQDVATQLPSGFNVGLAGLAELPGTLVEGAGQMLGAEPGWTGRNISTEAAGVPDPLRALTKYLKDVPEPQSYPGQIARGIGEMAGGTVPFVAGARPAAKLATAIPRAGTPSIMAQMGKDILERPGMVGMGEATGIVGAGTAIGTAREAGLGPEWEPYVAMAGGVVPPVAATTIGKGLSYIPGPVNIARRVGRGVAGGLADVVGPPGAPVHRYRAWAGEKMRKIAEPQTQKAQETVTRGLQQELPSIDPAMMQEAQAIQTEVPGIRMTLAEQAEKPNLLEAQHRYGELLSPEQIAAESARRRENLRAIEEAKAAAAPRAEYDPEVVYDTATGRIEMGRDMLNQREAALARREGEIASEIGATPDTQTSGAQMRDDLTQRRNAVKADMRRLADSYGLNDPSAINIEGLKPALMDAYRSASSLKYKGGATAMREHPHIAQIEELGDFQSLDALTELRSQLQGDLQGVLRNPNQQNAHMRRGLPAMIKKIDDFLDDLGNTIADPQLAQRYRDFRTAYRTQYINRFEKGAAYKVLTEGRRGYLREDEAVAKTFFDPNNPAAARQYIDIFGGETPALEAAAMDSLYNAAVRNGQVSEQGITNWLKKHRNVLQRTPGIRRRVQDYNAAIRNLAADREILRQRRQAIDQSILDREMRRVTNGQATTEQMIDRAMENPRRMGELVDAMETPAAKDQFSRAVWERVFVDGNPEYIEKNFAALSRALGPDQLRRARLLMRAIEKNSLVPQPKGPLPASQPGVAKFEDFLNTGLNSMSARAFAAQSGRLSWRYVGFDIGGRALRGYSERQAANILMEAMLDPNLARRLAVEMRGTMTPKKAYKLHLYLIAAGLGPDERAATGEDQRRRPNLAPNFVR